jgi:hypothetical protein
MENEKKTSGYAIFYVVRGPRPGDAKTHLLLQLQFAIPSIQCKCSACNVPPDAGLQKRASFSTLVVGLAGTED